jgi:5'-nucleotidase
VRPFFLISNDDGYASRGLAHLREALSAVGDVVVVAPEHEQSAASHALSLHRPLRLREVEEGVHAVDGTPADCVYIALHSVGRLLPRMPDVVVSGINLGLNLGQDVFYSGTVAAAREAALRGVPAVAASAHVQADYGAIASFVARLALTLRTAHARRAEGSYAPLLNFNVPPHWNGRVRAARLGVRAYEHAVDYRTDPRGRTYLWLGGAGRATHDADPETDTTAYDQGFGSLTALCLDLTDTATAPLVHDVVANLESQMGALG